MSAEVFIVLFRGVGGATQLPTAPLREALGAARFRHVSTYIASGNAVVVSDLTSEEVRSRVAEVARERFGFNKPVMVRTREEWSEVIARNPYPEAIATPTRLHAFALEAPASEGAVAALTARAAPSERVAVKGRTLYFHTPDGFGTSKLAPVIDRLLGVPTTARNWNTVVKLDELARAAAAQLAGSVG